jgi:hypothetical protein
LTGSATRKHRLVGGDEGCNIETDGFLSGKHRLVGGLPKRPSAACPSSFAVQRTRKYASRLRISGALRPDIFEQPAKET